MEQLETRRKRNMSERTDSSGAGTAESDRTDGASATQSHELLPDGDHPDGTEPSIPEKYRDSPGETRSTSVSGRVTEGDAEFISDLVEVHPDFDSNNALVRAWVKSLKERYGEKVEEKAEEVDEIRSEF